jgi:hypothetical protein
MPVIAKIAAIEFQGFDGRLRPARRRSSLATRVAVNGTGVLWDAWRADPCDITTVAVLRASDGLAKIEDYRAQVGRLVLVIDPLQIQWPGTLVMDVDTDLDLCAYPANYAQITARWRLLPASVPPTGAAP